MNYNIALIGATGNVGKEILFTLSQSKISIKKLFLIASSKSLGKEILFREEILRVRHIEEINYSEIDLVFFATKSSVSKKYVKAISKKVSLVIDLSSSYRMNNKIPLVVPEVNLLSLKIARKSHIVANPNCIAIPLVVTLKPLHEAKKILRVVISTYQSISGAGNKAISKLYYQTKDILNNSYLDTKKKDGVAFNVIPKINRFTKNGYTKEEIKVIEETKKILSTNIDITCTCVRVPVIIGHSISVNIEFLEHISVDEAYNILENSRGIKTDRSSNAKYFTSMNSIEVDEILVSRIRHSYSANNILNLWIVSNNLRKGAALNAVQIAERYIQYYL